MRPGRRQRAFSLLEVLIAMGIFFVAVFAILGLVSQNLQIARGLRLGDIDFTSVAAELAMTNRLEEGEMTGDFGDLHPGATWAAVTTLYSSNGLYQVDIAVDWPDNGLLKKKEVSILLYRPDSAMRGRFR
ncbi:MAG TPA: prepilin-type N-terminal cleavage/methylation domain-containing protein [Verrucomicrobiota bacterium]|nr:prepilin-type N-terminal cleavage/methylation domain-containing protein [Verrucomicrobiota bacterium]HNU50953.1 prepilin-type N-terminal cleavage/methylation domain-containing protein [Verrucomicrobiota bacterium]